MKDESKEIKKGNWEDKRILSLLPLIQHHDKLGTEVENHLKITTLPIHTKTC